MSRGSPQLTEARKEEIINACAKLYETRGFREITLKEIGAAKSEKTGICLEAFTTEPAVHFYSGNYMQFDSIPNGKNGVKYPKNGGFCLEAQHYPDSLNHPHFPPTVLRPGEVYRQKTVYRFSVR